MIQLSYIFDEGTFLAANRAMWEQRRMTPRNKWLGYAFLAALPVAAWLSWSRGMHFTLLAVIAANLLHWVFDWPLTRAMVRRRFKDMPSAGRRISWQIGPDKLKVMSDGGDGGELPWTAITGVWEGSSGFVLFQPHNVTHFLPRAAFESEEDMERIREWVARDAGPDASVQQPRPFRAQEFQKRPRRQ
jgi:hypothetical protein